MAIINKKVYFSVPLSEFVFLFQLVLCVCIKKIELISWGEARAALKKEVLSGVFSQYPTVNDFILICR